MVASWARGGQGWASFPGSRTHCGILKHVSMELLVKGMLSRTLLLVVVLHAELVKWRRDISRGPGLPLKVHRTLRCSLIHFVAVGQTDQGKGEGE